jgi:hypothetical protein
MSFASAKELELYKTMVEEIIHGDLEKKKMIDTVTAYAIDGIKNIVPHATDEEVSKVLMTFAIIMMRVNGLPLNVASAFIQNALEGYIASVAILAGAYTPDPANVPDTSKTPTVQSEFSGKISDTEWEDQLKGQYL